MKAYTAALLLALMSLSAPCALAGGEKDINQIEDLRYQAMMTGNLPALANILADEFVYHQPTGKAATKASYLEQLKSGEVKIYEARRYDVTIHVYNEMATAMRMTRLDVEVKGERRQVELRDLNVWALRDGRWQLVARQSAFSPK